MTQVDNHRGKPYGAGARKIKAANASTFISIKRDREAALRARNAYRLAIGLPPVTGPQGPRSNGV